MASWNYLSQITFWKCIIVFSLVMMDAVLVFFSCPLPYFLPWLLTQLIIWMSNSSWLYWFFSFNFFWQAKRDPYRFRFPIEMRFVDPNIDHLMYVNLYVVYFCLLEVYGSVIIVSLIFSLMMSQSRYIKLFFSLLPDLTDLTILQSFIIMKILIQMSYGFVTFLLKIPYDTYLLFMQTISFVSKWCSHTLVCGPCPWLHG